MVSDIMAERLTSHTAAIRDHPCLPGKVLEGITPTCQARKHPRISVRDVICERRVSYNQLRVVLNPSDKRLDLESRCDNNASSF